MKPKIFFAGLVFCFAWQVNAQTVSTQTITPNKVWHIEYGGACLEGDDTGCACYTGIRAHKVGNIKNFNGKEYYELLNASSGSVITYVREEGGKVFFYTEKCDKEYVMYDFNLNVGDEFFLVDPLYPFSDFQQDNPCELTEQDMNRYKCKVTEVDSLEYNNVKRKMLRLENRDPYFYDIWVEGIGCMRGIPYNVAQQMTGVGQLKNCYESDELIFVNENPQYCWVSGASVNNVRQDFINIFIDENNILHIVNAKDIPITVSDIQGRKIHFVFPVTDNYQTSISFLPKGLYMVSNKTRNVNFKIVIR